MLALSDALNTLLQVWSVGLPALALLTGWTGRAKWLTIAALAGLAILVMSLVSYVRLLQSGQVPDATGLEGLVLILRPTMYAGSVILAVLIHRIIHLWRLR